jgi:hypothetical protein
MMRVRYAMGVLGLAALVLLGAVGSASAKDQWFVLGHTLVKSTDPSADIKGEEGKVFKEDIKKTKISVDGADVEISKVVMHWNNIPDDTITNIGVVKAGGETASRDAPGHEATLKSVAVQYKILGGKETATITLWGFD